MNRIDIRKNRIDIRKNRMKTKYGYYYIFFNSEDYLKKLNYYKLQEYSWVFENQPGYKPTINKEDFPIVFRSDFNSKSLDCEIIEKHKERYFKIDSFVALYNGILRKKKLEKIIDKNYLV